MIRDFQWHPCADPELLEPWFPQLDTLKRNPFKSNGKRFVFRVVSRSGSGLYIKLEEKKGLLPWLRNVFSPKVRSEYESGKLLEHLGIPCIRYAAWGISGSSGILISHALSGYIPLSEFWFEHAWTVPDLSRSVLKNVAQLVTTFAENGLKHPDFHAGNILINPNTLELAIVDPYGIKQCPSDPARLLPCMLELRGRDISLELLSEILSNAGFPNAERNVERGRLLLEKRIAREWPRRLKQLMNGESKFASYPAEGKWIRKSAWYSPIALPEGLFPEELPTKTAEKIWTDSFRNQLERKPLQKIPVIFNRKTEKSMIYYVKMEKNIAFYGF